MANYTSAHSGALHDQYATKQAIVDIIYPVGSLYITTNSTNPGVIFEWGTWVQIKDKFILSAGDTYTAGNTGGTVSHTHTISHTHTTPATTTGNHTLTQTETPAHTHTRGTMEITGSTYPAHSSGVCWYNVIGSSGAFYDSESVTNCGKPSLAGNFTGNHRLNFQASRNWTGATSSVGGGGAHNHPQVATTTNSQSTTTSGETSNMPPYLVCYVWKRTA